MEVIARGKPWGFNADLLVSLADANLFCRPGNATGVVKTEPEAFFFTDAAADETCMSASNNNNISATYS